MCTYFLKKRTVGSTRSVAADSIKCLVVVELISAMTNNFTASRVRCGTK